MNCSRKGNAVAALTTALLTLSLSPTSYGGAITSANAPPPPPPTVIPGVIRLSCTLNVASFFKVLDANNSSPMNVLETNLDYEKADGAAYFKCIEGCDNLTWGRNRAEWPAGEVRPVFKLTQIGQVALPSLHLKLIDSKLFLETHVETAHRSWTGSIVSGKSDSTVQFRGREFYAHASTDEDVESTAIEEVKKLAAQLNRSATASARSHTELRCTVLQPGQMSKAQISKILATPPQPSTISAKEYKQATSIDHISQPYTDVLNLARKLDPDHRKAMIADFELLRGDLGFLKPVVAKVRGAVALYPDMTAENAWGYIAQLLGISPMSPSGIVIPGVVPLLIAEAQAVTK